MELCIILNKRLNSHQISAMADLALLEDLYAPIRCERVFRDCRELFLQSDDWLVSRFVSHDPFFWNYATIWNLKERNPTLECHTCASAGALHVGVFWLPGPIRGRSGIGPEYHRQLAERRQQYWRLSSPLLINTSTLRTAMLSKP